MAEDDPKDRRERHQSAGAAAAAALVGSVIGGPAGAIVGAALAPLLEPAARQVWAELSASGQRRMGEALASACEAGIPPDELSERVNASDRTQLLAGYALAAVSRTAWDNKVRTLGRSLASGLLADDVAKIDTEQLIIGAIADIEAPQLALLEFLVCWEPCLDGGGPSISGPLDIPSYSYGLTQDGRWHSRNRAWLIWEIGSARPRLAPVVPSLLGTLQRHGLAVQNDNAREAIEHYQKELEWEATQGRKLGPRIISRPGVASPPGVPSRFNSPVGEMPEPTWSPTELGEQVFLRFRDAGTELPDIWTSGQAASGVRGE